MENAKKTYAYQAIQDVLELLDRVNGMIELHRAQKAPDTLAIAGYERQREQFLAQLAELLAQFEVQIVRPPEAAWFLNLHRAFDRGLISVDDNYHILVSDSFGELEKHLYSLRQLGGKQLILPFTRKFYLGKENLACHPERVWVKKQLQY